MRVTNAVPRHRRKKRLMKRVRGFVGGRSKLLRAAKETLVRAEAFATRDRKARKRDFRKMWITRINAAARANGITYSQLIAGLAKAEIVVDRKQLSELAIHDPQAFAAVVDKAKAALA
ncbi:MAG: 50S ribosomal protein L20 [Planctomycetota bacterium]